jgi:hypothetical protein
MFQFAYGLIRRLSIVDVTRLLQLDEDQLHDQQVVKGYRVRIVEASELSKLLAANRVCQQIGTPGSLTDGNRKLVAAFAQDRVVSFIWLARNSVDSGDNFSRAKHLGTSIDMPEGTAFVYNAWTDPEHRGKRLIAALLSHAIKHRVAGTRALLTSIDWTNHRSICAFEFVGMKTIGTVVRMGRGQLQLSLLPNLGHHGLDVAGDAPGLKFAI